MTEADLVAGTDILAEVIAFLGAHAGLSAALGSGRVAGLLNTPPYPLLRVLARSGGSDGELMWLRSAEIQLEALGDQAGAPGSAALRRILDTALYALTELPLRAPAPGQAVVTAVMPAVPANESPLANHQPRWYASRLIHYHPGLA